MNQRYKMGLFLLRITVGIIFFIHGFDKFQKGLETTVATFADLGLPGFLAYIVAVIELIGGLAMVVGAGTRVMAALFALIMFGAIVTVKLSAGFLGGFEFNLILLVAAVHLLFSGSQGLALDSLLARSLKRVSIFRKR
ncbi:DoxX family protein [Tuberibacillus sp. Marseille-P3662]|uniref:DoxX family protein n=1 Tax=Tuberibacillus sp. Marseille-P3662 TaxID=1965358 RepID=UPI000A1CDEEE|nr:DoxX family protein [Tuberibacillus sp. Marseille-P3662]